MFTAAAHKNLMPDQPASGKIAWRLLVKAVVCIVRIYYPKDATDQGFCRDLACTSLCVWRVTPSRISAMLVPYEKIISQSWFERREKRANHCQNRGRGAGGFRGFGIAANFWPSLQRPSAVSCQSPAMMKMISVRLATRETKNAFGALGIPMPVSLSSGFPFDSRMDGQNEKTLCFILKPSLLRNS